MKLSDGDISFARAALSLRLQVLAVGGGPYPLQEVSVDLAEDGRTVIMMADDGAGSWAMSSFVLESKTTERKFHRRAQIYRRMFDEAPL